MKSICVLLFVAGVCRGSVIPLQAQALLPSASQVRIQDELGQYHFAHAGGPNSRAETRTADGVTRGGYSYVDGNGLIQSAEYISDPVNGFRVAATNLPVAPVAPQAIVATPGVIPAGIIPAGPAVVGPAAGGVAVQGAVEGDAQVVPAVAAAPEASAPEAAPAPAAESTEAPSSTAAPESQPPAEPASGDTAAVEAAPAPAPAPVNPFVPVQDTPEVIAARAQHLAAVQEAQARDGETGTEASEEPTETPETPEPAEEPSSTPETPAPEAESAPAPASEPAPAPAPAEPIPIPSALSTVGVAGPLPSGPIVLEPPVAAVAGPAIAHVQAVAAPSVAPVGAPLAAVGIAPAVAPIARIDAAQYRVQDELGQFAFGHIGGPNAREEISTADGITRGGYTYVDGNGLIQSASYISDPVNGFRVAATNIPLQPAPAYIPDSPEVAEAKEALFRAQAEHIAKL